VTKRTGKKVKHIPQRTCVGCRQVLPKKTLIRVIRTSEGLKVDLSGKASGRGAYLHAVRSCWERGMKGALANALKTQFTDQDRETLLTFLAGLPEETNAEISTAATE
jgi:predicted RNA-binding protein YlxR (DUF448 family)